MPLAFESVSHGTVAFGFFNIESDMLLLEQYFFFAPEFCDAVSRLARDSSLRETLFPGYAIGNRGDIGDLMGAIHGTRHMGFIGAVYLRFPFPEKPEDFKQKPEGAANREAMESLIRGYGEKTEILVRVEDGKDSIHIGRYRFSERSFQALIRYVWDGGYPRWKDGIRPGCVVDMAKAVSESRRPVFCGLSSIHVHDLSPPM